MNKNVVYALIFVSGVGAGILSIYSYFKKKFREKVKKEEKELADVRDRYYDLIEKEQKIDFVSETIDEVFQPEKIQKFVDMYTSSVNTIPEFVDMYTSSVNPILERKEDVQVTSPRTDPDVYIIAPEEFEDEAEYDSICLTLYSDGTICDENNEPIPDPERLIGYDWKDYLENASAAYFRNDDIETDFEVARDLRTYPEATGVLVSSDDP